MGEIATNNQNSGMSFLPSNLGNSQSIGKDAYYSNSQTLLIAELKRRKLI